VPERLGGTGLESRSRYSNRCEYMLTLVGYSVGFGNIWRFPYLTYANGGGAFLIPYFIALFALGLPLFILELGLGQMYRQGCLGVWHKMGLRRMQGVGIAATICTFLFSLYYIVILGWTLFYLGRTLGAVYYGVLPWSDGAEGFTCPRRELHLHGSVAAEPLAINSLTGLYNASYASSFWCPTNNQANHAVAPQGFVTKTVVPQSCPAQAAVWFWESQVLMKSSGMDELGGMHWGLVASYTVAWLAVYFSIFKGVASSGKVVYVTATLPYLALTAFFIRAITLPNAGVGVMFFVWPDFSLLLDGSVWFRAVIQIFYSLGVGFGSLIAFASHGNDQTTDFIGDAMKVSFINCGTSIFAGFVVFPVLGFVAGELSQVDPFIASNSLKGLSDVLSGTGLAFIAFPIAISLMPGSFFWAFLFFIMLVSLGIDSENGTVQSVVTVLEDAGIRGNIPKPVFTAMFCLVCYVCGLIFVTQGGVYWFNLFDNYATVIAMLSVTFLECIGLMWCDRGAIWQSFQAEVLKWTGRNLGRPCEIVWKFQVPALLLVMTGVTLSQWDLMSASGSGRYPDSGTGFLPMWSVWLGWTLAFLPLVGLVLGMFFPRAPQEQSNTQVCTDDPKAIVSFDKCVIVPDA